MLTRDRMPRMWRPAILSIVVVLPLVATGCGGSNTSNGSVPVVTVTPPSRTVTYTVPSSAMEPTIHCARPAAGCEADANDRVVVEEPAPRIRREDIVVFRAPKKATTKCGEGGTFVKRVIGLPGETVHEDKHGFIWIREAGAKQFKKLSESYIQSQRREADVANFNRGWRVPTGAYLTMGDNRAESCDSRDFGSVPEANVIGKVVRILRPG